MPEERIVGIDLGTTNSLVAYMEGEQPVVIPGVDGSNLVPSIVTLDVIDLSAESPARSVTVGNSARRALIEHPERAIYSVKRLMGRGLEDVEEELKLFPFRLAEDIQPGEVLRIRLGELHFTPLGNLRLHPAPAQAQRRALLRRRSPQGGHHRPRLL
jgi:molecular chaperone DnaK